MPVWFVGVATASAAALGCTLALGPNPVTTPPAEPSTVVGGEPVSDTEADEYSGVVAIVIGATLCTGTLIEDDLILTAAHCLRNVSDPNTIQVFNGLRLQQPSVAATNFGMHPDFDVDATLDAFDYGFVTILPGALDATPIPTVTDQEEWNDIESRLGDEGEVILVGYGLDPDASGQESLGVKNIVRTSARGFTETGIEFVAGGDGRDSCEGDSGGPALARNADGQLRVIGVTARGSDPCGDGGFYGVPYYALAWLSDAVTRPLCGEGCDTCNCLDTAPDDDDGCGCTSSQDLGPASWLWLVAALGLRVRRRSTR